MLNLRSFSEILEEMHSHESSSNTCLDSATWESHVEAFGLSQIYDLMSQPTGKITPLITVQQAYPIKNKRPPRPVRPSHQFNETQQSAYTLLSNIIPLLASNFDLRELKSAFRQAVLKAHPDQGGNSETFQDVKKSYQILLSLVKN